MGRTFDISNIGDNLLLFICVVLSITLLVIPDNARIVVADRLGMVLTSPYWKVYNFGQDVNSTSKENAWLLERVTELELQADSDARMVHDASRMAGPALDAGYMGELVPCRVMVRQRGRFTTMIKINSLSPVQWQPWQPVISASGFIGRIRTVINDREAWVELLSAPGFALGVEMDRTGLLGVLRPRGDRFVIEMVGRDEDVRPGDMVITSGIAEIRGGEGDDLPVSVTPRGFPVGKVVQVSSPSDKLFKQIIVEPAANMDRNETVFVVTPLSLDYPGSGGQR